MLVKPTRPGQPLPRHGPRPDLEGVRMGSRAVACRTQRPYWAPRVAAGFVSRETKVATRLRRFSGRVPRPRTTPRRRSRAAGAVALIASITGTRRRPRSITERWPRLPRRRTRRVDVRSQRHRSNARETACRQAAGGPWAPRLHSDPKPLSRRQRVPAARAASRPPHAAARREGKRTEAPDDAAESPSPPRRRLGPELSAPVARTAL